MRLILHPQEADQGIGRRTDWPLSPSSPLIWALRRGSACRFKNVYAFTAEAAAADDHEHMADDSGAKPVKLSGEGGLKYNQSEGMNETVE